MSGSAAVATIALLVAAGSMLVELAVSRANERRCRAQGAVDVPDAAYATMRWAYPAVFAAMAIEGFLAGPEPGTLTWMGGVVFAGGKALKVWAIVSLGSRWTYRVLVFPGAPLITGGPYRFLRHPNYVGVVGELMGMALMTGARVAGPVGTLLFLLLLRQRIAAEERALGLRTAAP